MYFAFNLIAYGILKFLPDGGGGGGGGFFAHTPESIVRTVGLIPILVQL